MRVLILGGAVNVLHEAREAFRLFTPDRIIACNHVGIRWPGRLDAWVTFHPLEMHQWQDERASLGRNTDYEAITYVHSKDKAVKARIDRRHPHMWPGQRNSGSSGLFATRIALDDGATHIVLAGIPIDRNGSHIVRGGEWHCADSYQETWRGVADRLTRVRSMGGWTRQLLGEPTREWLAASPADPADARTAPGPDGP